MYKAQGRVYLPASVVYVARFNSADLSNSSNFIPITSIDIYLCCISSRNGESKMSALVHICASSCFHFDYETISRQQYRAAIMKLVAKNAGDLKKHWIF